MLSAEENELLARVGPATPGGALLRRYWHPGAQSRRPRSRRRAVARAALGRRLRRISFAGRRTRVHRGRLSASARLDVSGAQRSVRTTLSLPRLGGRSRWRGRRGTIGTGRTRQLRCEGADAALPRSRRGGPGVGLHRRRGAAAVPGVPVHRAAARPYRRRGSARPLQLGELLEGQIDSAHVSHLHSSVPNPLSAMNNFDAAPRFDVHNTPWGYHIGALRSLPDGRYYTRITEFVMPYFQFIPPAAPPETALYDTIPRFMVCQVPIDDKRTTVWYIMWKTSAPIVRGEPGARWEIWNQEYQAVIDRHKFGQDRAKMRAGHFSGINNLLTEDMAVAESMGPIADRSREYLGSSDTAVARFRRQYLEAIRDERRGTAAARFGRPIRRSRSSRGEASSIARRTPGATRSRRNSPDAHRRGKHVAHARRAGDGGRRADAPVLASRC